MLIDPVVSVPVILAFDTSAAHCAAALLSGGEILRSTTREMTRGHAENLMPMLQDLLADCGVPWGDLTALGVGVGPGNFTGIRIAVSAARGLALGLDVPAVGVTGCEARVHLAPERTCVAIPAPRDMVYLCDAAERGNTPALMDIQQAKNHAQQKGLDLQSIFDPELLAQAIAQVAATRWETTVNPPAPLYARAADAAPSRDVPPRILD